MHRKEMELENIPIIISVSALFILLFLAALAPAFLVIVNVFCTNPWWSRPLSVPSRSPENSRDASAMSISPDMTSPTDAPSIDPVSSIGPINSVPSIAPTISVLQTTSSSSPDIPTSPRIRIPKFTKIWLFLSIICSILWFIIQSLNAIIFIWFITPPPDWCYLQYVLPTVLYFLERTFTTGFFILRAYDTFKNTNNGYNKRTIFTLILIGILSMISLLIAVTYIYWYKVEYILLDFRDYGGVCDYHLHEDGRNLQRGLFVIGILVEFIYNFVAVYLLVSKLCALIVSDPTDSKKIKSRASATGTVCRFHISTAKHNQFVLLMSKLIILLVITMLISYISFAMSFIPRFIIVAFALAVMVHLWCLYLNFKFSKHVFDNWFGGRACTKWCFPCMKTMALSWKDRKCGCCYVCCHCCCYMCCLDEEQIRIRELAKQEIALIVSGDSTR